MPTPEQLAALQAFLFPILQALLIAAVPLVAYDVHTWYATKKAALKQQAATDQNAANWYHLLDVAETNVRAAEQQLVGDKLGPARKVQVLFAIKTYLQSVNLPIDPIAIDAAVEAAVLKLNQNDSAQTASPVVTPPAPVSAPTTGVSGSY